MNRRAFVRTFAGGLLAAPLAAEAQPAGKVHRIGFFSMFPVGPRNPNWVAFVEGLHDHGYIEGKNLQIERRSSEGQVERLPGIAAELVALGLSVIVTTATAPTRAMKEVTVTVPIVFVGVADPVGSRLVTSLARPGGNVTGLASIEWELHREAVPSHQGGAAAASRVAILTNPIESEHG